MKNKKKLKKESFMGGVLVLMISHILIKILGLIYRVYLTNKQGFGDTGNAIYSSGFQIYALLLTFSSVGIPNAIAKLVSEKLAIGDNKGAHKIFKIAFVTFALIGFTCSLILFLGAEIIAEKWLQIPEAEYSLVALSPSIFFVTLISVIRGYFNGRNNVKVTANSQTIEQLFKMVFTIIVVELLAMISGINTTIMAAGANLATTLATSVGFWYLYIYYKTIKKEIAKELIKTKKYKYTRILSTIKEVLTVSIPMSLTSILGSLNKSIDSITVVRGLKNFLSENEAKIQYGILSGKVDTLVMLPMSFNVALTTRLIPTIAYSKAMGDSETIKKRVSFSILLTILMGLPCMAGLIFFGEPILKLLFPNQSNGAIVLQISAVSIIFIVLEQTISGVLQGLGKVIVPAIALTVGVVIKLILNLILIKIDPNIFILGGINGATASTVICHIVAVIIDYAVLRKTIKLKLELSTFVIKPLMATTIMIIGAIYTYNKCLSIFSDKLSIILAIGFAILIYGIFIIVFKILDKDNIKMIPFGKKILEILNLEKQ